MEELDKQRNALTDIKDTLKWISVKQTKTKELLCAIYKEYDPSKLENVDHLLVKYRGREDLLYKSVYRKYIGGEVPPPTFAPSDPSWHRYYR